METTPIPQPPTDPLIGNLRSLNPAQPMQSLMQLARTHGPIFQLALPGRRVVAISSQALVNEACDEERFDKAVHPVLQQVRAFAGDGLFTAETQEPNWAKAHRILMPAFGPAGVRDLFQPMLDIAEQLCLRWERFGEHTVLDVPDQMTRLTLDTIALCGFDYRFNSFYQEQLHPFIGSMVNGLHEAGMRTRRPEVANRLMLLSNRRYEADIQLMHQVADRVIAERRRDASAAGKKDLLNRMLQAKDPVSGEMLSDENIRYQLVTFLIAGHETTSGLLSFALYLMLKNPRALETARAQVDHVLGSEQPRLDHIAHGGLRYLEQVLMEALRLWPTAPAIGLRAKQATTLAGKYAVTPDDVLLVLLPMLHRDPAVWGPDVEAFRPERFDREAEAKLPPNAWKPFGNGQRACIGRPFAMQEAILVLAMLLQRFDLLEADPSYELRVKETLTLKPDGFHIRARLRNAPVHARGAVPAPVANVPAVAAAPVPARRTQTGPLTPLFVLYGSNAGSAQAFAERIGSDAPAQGYQPTVAPLDELAGRLAETKGGAVVIVTASYEGHPPDNARQFIAMLEAAQKGGGAAASGSALQGVRYAVFGCGNRQWARTYQAIPTRVDQALEKLGATRVLARGEADASGDFFGAFDSWYATLWNTLAPLFGKDTSKEASSPEPGSPGGLSVELLPHGRSAILRQGDLAAGQLVENRELVELSRPNARSKRHLAFALPEGMTYQAGDYLAVLPQNPGAQVERVLRRFGFAADSQVVLHRGQSQLTSLPTEHPISMGELLGCYVELAQPATRSQVARLAEATRCPPEKLPLQALAQEEAYARDVLGKRLSVLDLLERFAACELPFAEFLGMLPPLKPRQYSISSSPLAQADRCTLTVAKVDAPALSGQGRFHGVASTFLANLTPGTRVSLAVRPGSPRFRLPPDPAVPLVLICAGTGLAPFRGFLQERALQKAAGQTVGPALLFFGCDHPDTDFLYRDELRRWQEAGVVDVRPAFSEQPDGEVAFVQHRVWKDRSDVEALFRQGARIYVCGDGRRMAPAVRETLVRVYQDVTRKGLEEAQRWADEVEREHGRYVEDVFA